MPRFVPAVLALVALAPAATAGPYDDLLRAVPPNTNTLVMVNVKAAFASPLAKSEKWADDYFKRYQSGMAFVPPESEAVVIASEVNLSDMTRDHQIGLVKVRNLPAMNALADREGGATGQLSGQVVVLSPRDVYYVALPGSVLAAVYPANRQATARWIRHAMASKAPDLTPYLKRAADAAGAGEDVLTIAVDFAEVIDPARLKVGLPASPAVIKQKGVDVGLTAGFLASVQGITFTARITDRIVGTVRVDFALDVNLYKRITRELFLELLDEEGVAIPGMDAWETTYGEKSMTLSGPLTPADLRRILSLFAFPGHADEDTPKVNPGQPSGPATQRYLAAVKVILDDIRKTKDSPDYVKTATWHEKAAEQLEHIGRQAVDPIAVEAAFEVAKRLRAIGASLRGVPIDLEAIGRQGYYYSRPNWGVALGWGGIRPVWYGGGGQVETNLPQVRAEQAKVVAADQQRRVEVWTQIDQILADTSIKLTDKYKIKF
jgi:hypothetical protein